ncbi:hypothetical protein [Woeseia oceani]|uniref:Uncharacterized protein n=1 Tax=Woeseia oceani TaxID=1548547 RepID=A0A193LE88_9GAMM|nr:hypothetical protein [Woeseia oceani]ANO50845.1 hypothetical protein BA177_06160 [Woeseia oceani]
MPTFETKLKDGDIFAGRPVRLLSEFEAAENATLDNPNTDALYGAPEKGSKAAKQRMAKVRAKRNKENANVQEQKASD